MSVVTLYELRRRIEEEIGKEVGQIGTGGCSSMESSLEQVAMEYRERTGFVQGLKRALTIMEDMSRDG